MHDFFEEYGGLILTITVSLVVIGAGSYLFKSGYLNDWVLNYATSLGG